MEALLAGERDRHSEATIKGNEVSVFNTRVETGHIPASPSGFYPQLRLFIGMHRDPIIVWQSPRAVTTEQKALRIAENQMVDRLTELFRPTSLKTKNLIEKEQV